MTRLPAFEYMLRDVDVDVAVVVEVADGDPHRAEVAAVDRRSAARETSHPS